MQGVSETPVEKGLKHQGPLTGMRVLICGKGGSGKSSFAALMSIALKDEGYNVVILDGDASNPGGLARLIFGPYKTPEPLIGFFGGRECVECPVDNPSPLTRLNDTSAVTTTRIGLSEIPPEYSLRKDGIVLFQAGKIEQAYEGCEGPMSKITRDFVVEGDWVTLIDVEAGIEHFGRGVEKNVDVVIVVADPTFESFDIAQRVAKLCEEMDIRRVWTVLNKTQSEEDRSFMLEELKRRKVKVLGTVNYDSEISRKGLMGIPIDRCEALNEVRNVVGRLQKADP